MSQVIPSQTQVFSYVLIFFFSSVYFSFWTKEGTICNNFYEAMPESNSESGADPEFLSESSVSHSLMLFLFFPRGSMYFKLLNFEENEDLRDDERGKDIEDLERLKHVKRGLGNVGL